MGTVPNLYDPLASEGKTGLAHFGQTAGALSGASQIDWSKTGWNIGVEGGGGDYSGSQWYTPPKDMYGFQIGDNAGYLDPSTGKITYGRLAKGDSQGTNVTLSGSTGTDEQGWGASQYQYDVGSDYGLGSTALGIIPIQHNAQGQVSQFLTPVAGGGYKTVDNLLEAQQLRDEYLAWAPTTQKGQAAAAAAPVSTTGTLAPAATTPAAPTPTYNDLSLPGASETNWNETKDLYRQPTNAQKLQDSLAPPGTTNAQKVFDETPNQPSDQEQQWNAYSGIYGNPEYLTDFYQRGEQRAQTTLDRKAASGGWGDSGAAAKATGNLGAVFADRAIAGMGAFATTGMGMAGASDAGRTQRTNLYGSLAGAADSANNTQLSTRAGIAGGADTANLAQLTGGQSAAHSAQTDQTNRINGGIDRLTQLGNDQAALTAAGFSSADAELFSTQLAGLEGQWTAAGLTAQQQYQKAQELMQSLGLAANTAVNYYLSTKYGAKK